MSLKFLLDRKNVLFNDQKFLFLNYEKGSLDYFRGSQDQYNPRTWCSLKGSSLQGIPAGVEVLWKMGPYNNSILILQPGGELWAYPTSQAAAITKSKIEGVEPHQVEGLYIAKLPDMVDFVPLNLKRGSSRPAHPEDELLAPNHMNFADKAGVILVSANGLLTYYEYSLMGKNSLEKFNTQIEMRENEALMDNASICPKNRVLCILSAFRSGPASRVLFYDFDQNQQEHGFRLSSSFLASSLLNEKPLPIHSLVLHSYQGSELVGMLLYNEYFACRAIGFVYDVNKRQILVSPLEALRKPGFKFTNKLMKYRKNGLAVRHNGGFEMLVFNLRNEHQSRPREERNYGRGRNGHYGGHPDDHYRSHGGGGMPGAPSHPGGDYGYHSNGY